MINKLEKGITEEQAHPLLYSLSRPSVQPYLISWFKLKPQEEIAKVNIPTLIIQGDTDIQISITDAQLLHKKAKNRKLEIIRGMNHILKKVEGNLQKQLPSYNNPKLPLHEDLAKTILSFCNSLPNISL